jgi:Lar family restriction alleviation protein
MNEEFKPCPFCGGEASLIETEDLASCGVYIAYVRCDRCEIDGERGCNIVKDKAKTHSLKAWNTRAN